MGLTQIMTGGVDENINIDSNTLKVDGTNNRVGIGTATPDFHLDVNGNIALTEGQVLAWHDGSGNKAGDIYIDSSDNIVFRQTSSVNERLRIDSSGRLLVGTNTATKNADRLVGNAFALVDAGAATYPSVVVTGYSNSNADAGPIIDMQKSRGASDGSMTIVANNDRLGSFNFLGSDGTNFLRAADIKAEVDGTPGTNDMPGRLVFATTNDNAASPTERMRITSAGRVGIGETSPDEDLHVYSSSGAIKIDSSGDAALRFAASGTNKFSIFQSGGTLRFFDNSNSSERMRIDSTGRVGIGTSSPETSGPLTVSEASTSERYLTIKNTQNWGYGAGINFMQPLTDGGSVIKSGRILSDWESSNNSLLSFYTTNSGTLSERMRINSSGNVGIGTTSPSRPLHVQGTSSDTYVRVGNNSGGSHFGVLSGGDVIIETFSSGKNIRFYTSGATERVRVDSSGRLLVGTTAGTSSGGGGAVQTGGGGTMVTNSGNIANNGTLDITVGTSNLCYWSGFLFVNNINGANGNTRTQSTYSVFGNNQGATASFTQIATANGGSGSSFTVTYVDNGIIRFTNTSGATCNVSIGFFGGGLNMT